MGLVWSPSPAPIVKMNKALEQKAKDLDEIAEKKNKMMGVRDVPKEDMLELARLCKEYKQKYGEYPLVR